MNTVEILTNAKQAVAHSWTKGEMFYEGSVCAAGAIGVAILGPNNKNGPPLEMAEGLAKRHLLASKKAVKYLACAIDRDAKDSETLNAAHWNRDLIVNWNDKASRTRNEVLAGFDAAIKNAKRRHARG